MLSFLRMYGFHMLAQIGLFNHFLANFTLDFALWLTFMDPLSVQQGGSFCWKFLFTKFAIQFGIQFPNIQV